MIDTTSHEMVKAMVQKIDHFLTMYVQQRGWTDFIFFSEDADYEGRKYNTLYIYGDKIYELEYAALSDSKKAKYEALPEDKRRVQYIVDNYPDLAHAIFLKFNLLQSPGEVVPEDFEKMNVYYKFLKKFLPF